MAPPWSATAYIALALIICGVLLPVAYGHWLATRIFEPLAMPISLRRGHIRSKDFYINFRGRYWVEVDVDYPFTYSHPECPIYGPESVLTAHFTVSRDGRVIEELDALHDWFAGMFEAHRKGYYRLDVEVMSDASCLDAAHPRVVVGTGPGSYSDLQDALRWLSLFMVLGGSGLLALILIDNRRRRTEGQRAVIFERSGHYSTWPLRFPPGKPISGLPQFGLVCGLVVGIVMMVMLMLLQLNRPISRGLWVFLAGRNQPGKSPIFSPPVIVLIESTRQSPPRVYVNSKPVAWKDLGSALTEELKVRSEWVVYVEGDRDLQWDDVVKAIDTIRGVHARAVLLGSK